MGGWLSKGVAHAWAAICVRRWVWLQGRLLQAQGTGGLVGARAALGRAGGRSEAAPS